MKNWERKAISKTNAESRVIVTPKKIDTLFKRVEQNSQLTEEQVKNWRRVLIGIIGPATIFMSVDMIQKLRNKYQEIANKGRETDVRGKGNAS